MGIEPSAKNVWMANPEKIAKTKKNTARKSIEKMKTNAFNPDTRKIFSPVVDSSPVKVKATHKIDLNKSYQKYIKRSSYKNAWKDIKASMMGDSMKTKSNPSQIRLSKKFNKSVDLGSTMTSDFNRTFSSGFGSTFKSTGLGSGNSLSASGTFCSSKRLNKSFQRVNGYKRVNRKVPSYDFTGKNSTWMNKQGVIDKSHKRDLSYSKILGNPKPCAHKNGRKFSPMTTFYKNLEDNRVFSKWKMSAFRGNYK